MRKLVTIRTISNLEPIPGADLIEVAVVDGWKVVVKKGDFKEGQRVVYFEIDSILPEGRPEFEFLMARGCKNQPTADGDTLRGHRLRTIKLRGQVSQGFVIPIPEFLNLEINDEGTPIVIDWQNTIVGQARDAYDDLSDIFGVKKYEKPIPATLQGVCRGNYPSWLPKTDQERVQNIFDEIPAGVHWTVEEKIEGSSITVYVDENGTVGVTSRNMDLELDQEGNTFVDVAKKSGLLDAIKEYWELLQPSGDEVSITRVAVRGELIGPNIQGNIYNLKDFQIVIYDLFIDLGEGGRYVSPQTREIVMTQVFLPRVDSNYVRLVPEVDFVPLDNSTLDDVIARADGQSVLYPTPREGIVFKAITDRGVFSFKAISNAYLLKEKE